MSLSSRFCASATIVCAVVLALPNIAAARVEVTAVFAKPIAASSPCTTVGAVPAVTQAGKRTDFCVAFATNGGPDPELGDLPGLGDDTRDLTLSLPPGQVATPTATPLCPRDAFLADRCSASSQVGEVTVAIDVFGIGRLDERLLRGKAYNLKPIGTEGSRLGFAVDVNVGSAGLTALRLETETRLRASDRGLDSVRLDSPRDVLGGLPIELRRFNLRLWGSKADHPSLPRSYASSPTACVPATTTVKVVSYRGVQTSGTDTFTPTGCDKVPYEPGAIFESDRVADEPGRVTAGATLPWDESPIVQSHTQRATVTLPAGFELSPTIGANPNFTGCDDEQFNRRKEGPVTCPADSQIGTVLFRSPLLSRGDLVGKVYLANPRPGEPRVRFFVVAEAGPERDAVRVKVEAKTRVDAETGRLITVLDDLPATPFQRFEYSFFGKPNAPLAMPRQCGSYASETVFEPMSGTASKTVETTVSIDQGCKDPELFTPTFTAGVTSPFASASTNLVTQFDRPSGHSRMKAIRLDLPTGLSGRLTAAPQCPLAQAAVGECSSESRIGRVDALSGGGLQPTPLSGDVYLTEGPGGALAGLSMVVKVMIGPLDFGRTITQATISTRPDLGLTLTVPEIPTRQQGVDSNLQRLRVTLEKPGFNLNSSSCAPKEFVGTVWSDTGSAATVRSPYQASGCDRVPYDPKVSVSLGGGPKETAEGGHPSLSVTVSQQEGEAGSAKMVLTLPKNLSPDSERLRSVCSLADYERDACAPETVKGRATAWSRLLPQPLSGPVTFVQIPGSALPGLRIKLQGALPVELTGRVSISADNRVVNTIDPLPDTPLARFNITLDSSANSPLVATKDLCTTRNVVNATATSHAGGQATPEVEADVPGCRPTGSVRVSSLRSGRPSLDLRVAGGRTGVRTAQLLLPRGLEFQRSSVVKRRLRVSATGIGRGSRARVSVSGNSIRVTVPGDRSAAVLRVRLAPGAVRVSRRLRSSGRPRLAFGLTTAWGRPGGSATERARTVLRVRPAR